MSYFNAYPDTNGDTVYTTGPIPVVNDVSAPVADRDADRDADRPTDRDADRDADRPVDDVYAAGPVHVADTVYAPGWSARAADNFSLTALDWHDRAKFVAQLHAFQLGIADAVYHLDHGADDQYALATRALDAIARRHNVGLKACILAYVGTQLPRPASRRGASVYRDF